MAIERMISNKTPPRRTGRGKFNLGRGNEKAVQSAASGILRPLRAHGNRQAAPVSGRNERRRAFSPCAQRHLLRRRRRA
jgi:hypothetical protein